MQKVLDAAKNIKLFVCDVDGVLTNGNITYDNNGNEIKQFHVQDGLGLKLLQKVGVSVGIITARESAALAKRAGELGIKHVYQGKEDKRQTLLNIMNDEKVEAKDVAYAGDDLMDLALIRYVGLGITVPNAHSIIREFADWQTTRAGGDGAIRECCDLILRAQDHYEKLKEHYSQWLN